MSHKDKHKVTACTTRTNQILHLPSAHSVMNITFCFDARNLNPSRLLNEESMLKLAHHFCFNYFSPGHRYDDCRSLHRYEQCNQLHHHHTIFI